MVSTDYAVYNGSGGGRMNHEIFRERYKRFSEEDEAIQLSINTIIAFEHYIEKDIEESTLDDLKAYMNHLIITNANKYNNVIHIARYYYYVDMKDHYIQMTKYFNTLGVLENIVDRIELYGSKELKDKVLQDIELPPFLSDSTDMPHYTKRFLDILNKHIPQDTCNHILAGNNHGIPKESFDQEKQYYNEASSFKEYLLDKHARKVQELTDYYNNNQIWFEQVITPDVIEFVKDNPEILGGTIKDDKLYITKIPYDINNFLNAENDTLARYYACHCSFVRENIKQETEDIPKEWCYCSGGFAKYPFEVLFDQELDVKLLTTPLDGQRLCRFEIDLSNVDYKK